VLQDDSWFAFIAAADEGDDWTDPEVWRKANPSFGLSVKADDLARKAEKAIALPGAQNAFRRMHLNEWTEQAERWIDIGAWDACDGQVNLEHLRGRRCFGGLDLSTTTDVTALAWVFPPEGDHEPWHVLSRYFVPEENLRRRAERDRVPYDLWTRQGFIEATPGNVVDYGAIEQRILADAALFQVKEIAYDPWNATHIALRLQDEGATMVEFRQGFRSMAAPTRELEKLIVSQKLAHGGNPVTRWMALTSPSPRTLPATSSPPRTRAPSASMASSPSSWPSAAPWSPRKSPSPRTPCSFYESAMPRVSTKTPQIIRAFDESESYRLPVGWNVAPVALCRALNLASPLLLGIAAARDEHALGTVSLNSCSDLCHEPSTLSWWRPVGASAVGSFDWRHTHEDP
jgi:hypothetical protein